MQKLTWTLATLLAVATACATVLGPASAQNLDVIKERKETFKTFLPHVKVGRAMVRGEADFDLDKAKASLAGIAEVAPKLKTMFPDDSKEGGETAALPAIWEKKDDFVGRFDKLAADATAASGSISDAESFKTAWGEVLGNCGACHKAYRVEKK